MTIFIKLKFYNILYKLIESLTTEFDYAKFFEEETENEGQKSKIKHVFSGFAFTWDTINGFTNIVILFYSIFWISFNKFPSGISLFIGIVAELIFLMDFILRIFIHKFRV